MRAIFFVTVGDKNKIARHPCLQVSTPYTAPWSHGVTESTHGVDMGAQSWFRFSIDFPVPDDMDLNRAADDLVAAFQGLFPDVEEWYLTGVDVSDEYEKLELEDEEEVKKFFEGLSGREFPRWKWLG